MTTVWINPTGNVANGWPNPELAYDDNLTTGPTWDLDPDEWTPFFEYTHEAMWCKSTNLYFLSSPFQLYTVDVDVYYDADWHHMAQNVYAPNGTFQISMASNQLVTAFRVRFQLYDTINSATVTLAEVNILATAPTVTVEAASDILETTATGNGTITYTNGVNATKRGFYYSIKSTIPEDADFKKVEESGDFGAGAFSLPITGLLSNTKYYIRTFATNGVGTSVSSITNFTTLEVSVTTQAAAVPVPVSNPAYCEFADGHGTITSGVNATERGFEVKHVFSGTLYDVIVHEMAGFVGDTTLNGTVWEGTLIKIEHEHGDFVQGAFTLELGAFPAFFYDQLFAGESYTYRAYAVIGGVTYYGEWVAFSLGVYTEGGGTKDDNVLPIEGFIPIEPPIEPVQPPFVSPVEEEEFPPFELPEFEFPEFTYPEFPPYNGSWLGWFYYRKPYTKKDLDELRKKCRIFQDNSVEYALVLNHNSRVLQQFLNSMTEYLGADEYNTFRPIIPTQHLNELSREALDIQDFKAIINDFINNITSNMLNVNNNFLLIRNGLSSYTSTEDVGFTNVSITTKRVEDDNPDVVGLKKVIDRLNGEMSNNYATINDNLNILRGILI